MYRCQCGCGGQFFSSTMKVPGMNSGKHFYWLRQPPWNLFNLLLFQIKTKAKTKSPNKHTDLNCKDRFPSSDQSSASLHSVRLYRLKQLQGLPKIPGSFNLSLQLCCLGWEGCVELTLGKAIQPPALLTKLLRPRGMLPESALVISSFTMVTTRARASSSLYDGLIFGNIHLFFMT